MSPFYPYALHLASKSQTIPSIIWMAFTIVLTIPQKCDISQNVSYIQYVHSYGKERKDVMIAEISHLTSMVTGA